MLLIGRMLRARWSIIAICLTCSLLGALLATVISPPRYDAEARVTLNFLHSDPVTGVFYNEKSVNKYINNQLNMVSDLQVVGPAVVASGWLDDPELIAAYQARPARDTRDMATWAAARAAPGVRATMVQDSNILKISFRALSPEIARAVVSAVRDSFVDLNISERRASALGQAQMLQAQAEALREEAIKLQAEKGAYERKTGIYLREDDVDLATVQMLALAPSVQTPRFKPYFGGPSKAEVTLLKLDSQIADAAAVLGPNHPQIAALKANREATARAVAAQDQAAGARTDMAATQEAMRARQFDTQKGKVLGQRAEVLHLRLLQDDINQKRAAFTGAMAAAGKMREMSTMVESGVSLFGDPKVLRRRAFPNEPLIYGGAAAFGLLGGITLALLTEMFNLRVRTASALSNAVPAPILGLLPPVRLPGPARAPRHPRPRRAPKPRLQSVGAQ